MYTYTKFFDPAIAEPAAAPVAVAEQPLNIAAMMAKQGVKNETDQMVAIPIEIEKKEETIPAKEVSPVATTTESSSQAEPAKPESQNPVVEPVKVQKPQIVAELAKVQSWQEVLKSQQPDTVTVLNELGFDDKVVNLAKRITENPKMAALFNHWETKGNVIEYMKAATTDFEKMPAEEVMRHQLRKEYPTAKPEAIEALYKREIINAYNLNSDEETEAAEGRLLLEAKADRYRAELMKNQQEFLLPPPPEPQPIVEDNTEQLRKERDQQLYLSRVNEDSYTKNMFTNNKIVIGEGENKFNFPVNAQDVINVMADPKKYAEALFDIKEVNGHIDLVPKVSKLNQVGAFILYGQEFLDAYAQHFKSIGGEKAIEPIVNARMPDKNTASVVTITGDSPAAQLAKGGKVNYGGR